MDTKRRQKTRVSRDLQRRATWLVHWLNDDLQRGRRPNPVGRARILEILNRLSQIQAKIRSDLLLWQQPEVEQMARELESFTRVYRTWLRFAIDHRPGKIGNIKIVHAWESVGLDEGMALSLIGELLKARVFDGLTMCKWCKQGWVFRVGAHGHFCSVKCRTALYESQAARKSRKRELAKAAYWDLMEKAGKKRRSPRGER